MRDAKSGVPFQNLRLLKNYLRGDSECDGLPTTAVMGVTNRCDLSCPMCLRSVMEFPGPELGFDFFRTVIDQGAPFFRYISLDGPGEPMLNPDIRADR